MRNHLAVCAQQSQARVKQRRRRLRLTLRVLLIYCLASTVVPVVDGLGVRELAPAIVSAACCAGPAETRPAQDHRARWNASDSHSDALAGPSLAAKQETGGKLPHAQAPAARGDSWLVVSLGEYQQWRELLETRPEEARQMVARAVRSVLEDPRPLPISMKKQLAPQAQKDFERRTLRDRGLLVWRTLETVIGRERVDHALAARAEQSGGQTASMEDFRKACEEISGRNLRWFFDYYLDGTELPRILLRRIPGNAPNEFAGEIVLENVPAEFQVRVEMRLFSAAGVIHHSVATNGPVTPFTVTTNEPVSRIVLDPDARILRKMSSPKP